MNASQCVCLLHESEWSFEIKGVLRICKILRLEEEYIDSTGLNNLRGVLRFHRSLRFEEEQ